MADSETMPEQQQLKQKQHQAQINNHVDGLNGDANLQSSGDTPTQQAKQTIAEKITGTVKWFNVKSGYGFINRNDTKEDVFVHQTAIIKNNPKKAVRSVGDGELVEFDVVLGDKGNEAANVSGPDGEPVRGSQFAAEKRRGFRLWRQRIRRRQPRKNDGDANGGNDNEGSGDANQEDRGDKPKPRQRRYRRGRFNNRPNRPRSEGNDNGAESGGDGGGEGGENSGGDGGGKGQANANGRRFFRRNFRGNGGKRRAGGAGGSRKSDGGDGGQQSDVGGQGGGDNNNGGGGDGGERRRANRPFRRPRKRPSNNNRNQNGGQQVQNTDG